MATFLVTYDLNNETNRPNILRSIREDFDGFAMLSESSYAISTAKSVQTVYNHLKEHIDGDDVIYIITLNRPFLGFGSKEVNDWLDANLAY